jgi:glucose-1-phosphate cytidylyltransferase
MSDVTIDMKNNSMKVHQNNAESWSVTLVDTGIDSMTGGRLKRVSDYIKDDDVFCFTYGDGLADIDITNLIKFHKSHGKLATLTVVRPPARYGSLTISESGMVDNFQEKLIGEGGWINGGYFIMSPKVLDRIEGDYTKWELEPLSSLVEDKQLVAYKHDSFWQPMDTLREKKQLNELWNNDKAPWKVW